MINFENRYTGDIVEVINNPNNLSEGDLRQYARVIFAAPNIHHGYHGLRHMLHVTWVCYQACNYYSMEQLSKRQMRNLLIAALFHDYDHVGQPGDDAINLNVAVAAMRKYLLPFDGQFADAIERIMRVTQYPHVDLDHEKSLEQSIIRDADMSQALGPAWIGDILAGYGSELGKTTIEMLEQQEKFLAGVRFSSDFGKIFFGQKAIDEKTRETQLLLAALKT